MTTAHVEKGRRYGVGVRFSPTAALAVGFLPAGEIIGGDVGADLTAAGWQNVLLYPIANNPLPKGSTPAGSDATHVAVGTRSGPTADIDTNNALNGVADVVWIVDAYPDMVMPADGSTPQTAVPWDLTAWATYPTWAKWAAIATGVVVVGGTVYAIASD